MGTFYEFITLIFNKNVISRMKKRYNYMNSGLIFKVLRMSEVSLICY